MYFNTKLQHFQGLTNKQSQRGVLGSVRPVLRAGATHVAPLTPTPPDTPYPLTQTPPALLAGRYDSKILNFLD